LIQGKTGKSGNLQQNAAADCERFVRRRMQVEKLLSPQLGNDDGARIAQESKDHGTADEHLSVGELEKIYLLGIPII